VTTASAVSPRVGTARPVWLVMARKRYEEPLYMVGTVTADNPDMAALFAQSIYDEQPWVEMVIAPKDAFKTVIKA
jgi:1,2-phenylacetyl-CoA epoxidase PaaB subunit